MEILCPSRVCVRVPPRGRKKIRVTTCYLLPYGRSEWKFDGGSTVPPKAGASRPID